MGFPLVMYGCESWTTKKAEHRRNDAFELWCWRSLFRVPLDCKIKPVHSKGNQSWMFTERSDAEAEATILWPLATKNWLIRKDPDPGKDWRWEEKGTTKDEISKGWITSLTQWTWVWVDSGSWWWTRRPGMLQSMGLQRVKHSWATSWRRRGRKQTIKKNVFYQISILGNTLKEKKAQNLQQLFASCNKLFKFLSLI